MPKAQSPRYPLAISSSTSSTSPSSLGSNQQPERPNKKRSRTSNGINSISDPSLGNAAPKARLTANQKSDNHKEAENRRRNGIRDQYIALSEIVPDALGQEKSEEKMLVLSAEHMKHLIDERHELIDQLQSLGGDASQFLLAETEWGGLQFDNKCEREYLKKRAERVELQGYDEADELEDERLELDA